jgi:hypothetical protein
MFPSMCKINEKEWPLPPNHAKSPLNMCLHVLNIHLKDDCSHVISAVQPQGSNQPKASTKISKGDNNEKSPNASHSKYGF